jgi:hypothetical protein
VMVIDGGSRRIVGQLVPPQEVTVQLVRDETVSETRTDRLGRFSFADVAPGPVRLAVLGSGGEHLVHTEWLLL